VSNCTVRNQNIVSISGGFKKRNSLNWQQIRIDRLPDCVLCKNKINMAKNRRERLKINTPNGRSTKGNRRGEIDSLIENARMCKFKTTRGTESIKFSKIKRRSNESVVNFK
jgi:hypothetical protein